MEKLSVIGGKKLFGSIKISGSKNSSLPILAATLLSNKKTQAGLYLIIGNYKALGKNFLINTFGGFGILYYHYEKTYNEMIYNYSLRFKTKDLNHPANFIDIDTPFTETQDRIYPIVHFGVKIGFNGIKNAK